MGRESQTFNTSRRKPHRTVDRIASILECVARSHAGITLSEISKALDAPFSSTQDLIHGLVSAGYVEEHDKRYFLGSAPYLLNRLAGRQPVSTVTHSDLEMVHEKTGLTSVLSIAVGESIYYVDYCSSDPRLAYLAENYVRRSLMRTSSGWVLLAGMEKRDLWAHLNNAAEEDKHLVDRFFEALPEIERTGICAGPNASTAGDGVSIAVVEQGITVAAVGVVASNLEIAEQREQLAAVLKDCSSLWSSRPPA